ncbi:hypothetical protein P9112_004710 [Eukaryota sp. TZLM1-RC]
MMTDITIKLLSSCKVLTSSTSTWTSKAQHLSTLCNHFSSLHDPEIRTAVISLCSFPLWTVLQEPLLNSYLSSTHAATQRRYRSIAKSIARRRDQDILSLESKHQLLIYGTKIVPSICNDLGQLIVSLIGGNGSKSAINYTLSALDFLRLLLLIPITRRFVRPFLLSSGICSYLDYLIPDLENNNSLVLVLRVVQSFLIVIKWGFDDISGDEFNNYFAQTESLNLINSCISKLFICEEFNNSEFTHLIKKLSQIPAYLLLTKSSGLKNLQSFPEDFLRLFCKVNGIQPIFDLPLTHHILFYLSPFLPISSFFPCPYPNHHSIWDLLHAPPPGPEVLPKLKVLPVNKITSQSLGFCDYLIRRCTVYNWEGITSLREDLEKAVRQLRPTVNQSNLIDTQKSNFITPLFKDQCLIDGIHHDSVFISINFPISQYSGDVLQEWKSISRYDTIYLLSISGSSQEKSSDFFPSKWGIEFVVGVEVVSVNIDDNQVKITASLDKSLIDDVSLSSGDPLSKISEFNFVFRRSSRENNYASILNSVKHVINRKFSSIPDWFQSILIGFGSPESCLPSNLDQSNTSSIVTTAEVFESHQDLIGNLQVYPNLVFTRDKYLNVTVSWSSNGEINELTINSVTDIPRFLTSYTSQVTSPFPYTDKQFKAIMSALSPGLTMVVGPPGTGKTDVASQVVSCLLNSNTKKNRSRILLITHSNDALNQLFEKIVDRGVDSSRLVRLGHGEAQMSAGQDFSREGRVDSVIAKRNYLLGLFNKMADAVGISNASSCENCLFLFSKLFNKWNEFVLEGRRAVNSCCYDYFRNSLLFSEVFELFGIKFFPVSNYTAETAEEDLLIVQKCKELLDTIQEEVTDLHPFEIFTSPHSRGDYLVSDYANLVAMTATHAGLRLPKFLESGFYFDSFIMEESAQCVELEAFLPLLINSKEVSRVLLIGDHNQLPPIIKSNVLSHLAGADQSLFGRFISLGVPSITLDYQGRCRPSLSSLFKWKYPSLYDFCHVKTSKEFCRACPGFGFDYQLINVDDYNGKGEHEPVPHYFQNLGEAELVILTYMYMRLIGYPNSKISILTTYVGQKDLLEEVFKVRCKHPFFKRPAHISTVDAFQGRDNDYVLLSLVRSKSIGHLADVRRLVVAFSRAKLGLWVFGRRSLFTGVRDSPIEPTFSQLAQRPGDLVLVSDETFKDCQRTIVDEVPEARTVVLEGLMSVSKYVGNLLQNFTFE